MSDSCDRLIFVICQGEVFHCSHQATVTRTALGRIVGNEILLPDPFVSRNHAVIEHHNDTWILRDLDSRNGTFINQQRIQESEVRGGDVIQIGPYHLTIYDPLANSEPFSPFLEDDTLPVSDEPLGREPQPRLTPSRQRVYQQLLEGHSVKVIAHHLNLSPHTIHWHVKAVYNLFGVSSQAELLAQRLREISS